MLSKIGHLVPVLPEKELLAIIAAMDQARGIGYNNQLPWRIPSDLKRFKLITSTHTIVMGRKTWESIGRALPHRRNILLSRRKNWRPACHDIEVTSSAAKIVGLAKDKRVFIIGGEEVYKLFLVYAQELHLSIIDGIFPADRFFPDFDQTAFSLRREEILPKEKQSPGYRYQHLVRIKDLPVGQRPPTPV